LAPYSIWISTESVVERSLDVDNIIILTGDSEADERLTTSIRALFPECKIQVLSNLEEVPVPAEPAYEDNIGRKSGKLFDCR
jgi:hypothetical protein